MSRTVLLTLGRLPKALDIARALHAAGCRVLVAEPFKQHLTGASRSVARSFVVPAPVDDLEGYLAALLNIIVEEQVDDVLPVSEEILYVSLLRDRLPAKSRLHAMPFAALQSLHDKQAFVATCAAAGVAVPQTAAVGSSAAADLLASGRCVLKPVISCSGRGLRFLDPGVSQPQVDEPAIIQRFIAGQLISTFSLARAGQVQGTVVYRGAVMQGTVAVAFERLDLSPSVRDWIARVVEHTRFDGFVSFDLIEQPNGDVVGIECNPRATSGLHFVEPADLARWLLTPAAQSAVSRLADSSARVSQAPEAPSIGYRRERLLQQFYPCLTETQKSMFGRGDFRANLACLWAARDVSWHLADPWPALSMPWTSWPIIEQSVRRRCSFGEVAMLDLMWRPNLPSSGQLA